MFIFPDIRELILKELSKFEMNNDNSKRIIDDYYPFIESFVTELKKTQHEPPPLLYHYTTPEGLLSILKNKYLYATNFKYLNDPRELFYCLDRIHVNIVECMSDEQLKNGWMEYYKYREKKLLSDVYIASFCEDGDLLSQWRGYGLDGKGFSISFNCLDFRNTTKTENLSKELLEDGYIGLIKVSYDNKLFSEIIRKLIRDTSSFLEDYTNINNNQRSMILNYFIITIEQAIYIFKNPVFKEENEWRLLNIFYAIKNNIKFYNHIDTRVSNNKIIPFVKFPIKNEQFKEIIIGPKCNKGNTESVLNIVAKKIDESTQKPTFSYEILSSKIPYV